MNGVLTHEYSNLIFTDNVTKGNILNENFSSVFVVDDSQSDETFCLEGHFACNPFQLLLRV